MNTPSRPLPYLRFISAPTYSPDRYVPYRLLWIKVIIRAAYDYALCKGSDDLRLQKFSQAVEKWLFEPSTLMNGFDNICHLCRLPREKLRTWARNLTRDQVKKLEFLERQGKDPLTLALDDPSAVDDGISK